MKRSSPFFYAIFFVTCMAISASAVAAGTTMLGKRHVRDIGDTDTIQVGRSLGKFTGLRVDASGSAVEFKRVVVHFENGTKQVFEKNRLLRKGKSSGVIDLEGGARLIDRIVMHYEARSPGWKGAEVRVFGIR